MKNNILTIIAMMFLFSPQTGILADDKTEMYGKDKPHKNKKIKLSKKLSKFLKGEPFEFLESHFVTKEELEAVNQAIDELNVRIISLGEELENIPPDLVIALAALQKSVGDNSGDISLALGDVERILVELESVLARLSQLEESGGNPPVPEKVIFSGHFIGTSTPESDSSLGIDWIDFKNNASGSFSAIEISGSVGKGVSCSDPERATVIANTLNSYALNSPLVSVHCEDREWIVGTCGSGVELSAGSFEKACSCFQEAAVRPLIGDANWGGIGNTCNAPSQTLEVILTR